MMMKVTSLKVSAASAQPRECSWELQDPVITFRCGPREPSNMHSCLSGAQARKKKQKAYCIRNLEGYREDCTRRRKSRKNSLLCSRALEKLSHAPQQSTLP